MQWHVCYSFRRDNNGLGPWLNVPRVSFNVPGVGNCVAHTRNSIDSSNFYSCRIYGWTWTLERHILSTYFSHSLVSVFFDSSCLCPVSSYRASSLFEKTLSSFPGHVLFLLFGYCNCTMTLPVHLLCVTWRESGLPIYTRYGWMVAWMN